MSILYTVLTFFVPAVIIICGYIMKNCHSAEPNPTVGYRTARSMSSRESWVFANERCGGGISAFLRGVLLYQHSLRRGADVRAHAFADCRNASADTPRGERAERKIRR